MIFIRFKLIKISGFLEEISGNQLLIQFKLQAQNNIATTSLDFRLNNGALLGEEVCMLNSRIDDGIETKIMAVA
jgi:hypothetical protein